jgi:hypothetical protein
VAVVLAQWGGAVIRFCDLREAYWLYPEDTKGPIAFIDTVTDTFVSVNGQTLFNDFGDLIESLAIDKVEGRIDDGRVHRLCSLVPEALR